MGDHVFWIVQAAIKPGELDNFKALVNEMVDATRANEPGALNYEYFVSADGKQCHIYERYADSAAAMTHMGNFQAFAERFMAALEITGMTFYGNPSDELRAVADGFGAVYMAPLVGFAR